MDGTVNNYQLGNPYVRVFYRIFPLEKENWEQVKIKNSSIFVRRLQQLKDPSKAHEPPSFWEFTTDGVFHNWTQDSIYNTVAKDLIDKLENGNSTIIVSFGQTGTGKSVTLSGIEFQSEENFGLAPRVLRNLINLQKTCEMNKTMSLEMTFIEIGQTAVFDLFKTYPNNMNIWSATKEATKIEITSENQALKELFIGEGRKDTKENKYYSHVNTSVLSFYVTLDDLNYSEGRQVESRIHLIDLAGCDTVGNLTCLFKTKKEVGAGNLAKTTLEQFFLSLIERSQQMIRARQRTNPLVYFLKDDLNINSSLRFVGHIKTTTEDLQTTLSMLRFGQILRGYTPIVKNIEQPAKMSLENKVKYLQRRLQEIQEERIQNSILLNEDLTANMNQDRIEHLHKTVKSFLLNDITDIDVMRVTDVGMVFNIFKEMYNNYELEKRKMMREGSTGIVYKKGAESESSLQKKKGSIRSNSTLNNSRSSKEKRRSKRISKESSEGYPQTADKEISVQSFFDLKTVKSKSLAYRPSQDRSSISISQNLKSKRSKNTILGSRRSSMIKGKSAGNIIFGTGTDILQIPENIPENTEAWNAYTKEPAYLNFMTEYKSNEKNITDTYTQYLEELKTVDEEKSRIDAMKQEILEAKLMMKYQAFDSDKCTETILNEATNKCTENIERSRLALLDKQEVVLRSLAELKSYLNVRKDLHKQLFSNYDAYCKEKFNIPLRPTESLSLVEMVKDSIQSIVVDELPIVTESVEFMEEIESMETQIKEFKKLMDKERQKVVKLRENNRKNIYDKPCYTYT